MSKIGRRHLWTAPIDKNDVHLFLFHFLKVKLLGIFFLLHCKLVQNMSKITSLIDNLF